jgi:hypothetical protein
VRTPRRIAAQARHRLAARRRERSFAVERERERRQWDERAAAYAEAWAPTPPGGVSDDGNPLRAFFNARTEGAGIWKWDHYFDVYHRHLERFRNSEVHILEIGIYSGGSLELWREYFGPRCHIYGVDVEEACLRYAGDSIHVFIGDQADRDFWRRFRSDVPRLDIVVDDGGHQPDQQSASLEELLPHLAPGGVYIVEDVHGVRNPFAGYTSSLVDALNAYRGVADHQNPERRKVSRATPFQSAVDSIHSYPYVTVIEKRHAGVAEFVAPKRGTQWEPFIA